jgi:4a-hydroxytetrahydrobiopterin dehydratase
VLYWGAYAYYACDSLSHAVSLVDAVATIAEEVGHYPDLDVRPHGVTIRTFTKRSGGLGPLDAERWTIASPDNHGVDVAIWPDFEDYENEV